LKNVLEASILHGNGKTAWRDLAGYCRATFKTWYAGMASHRSVNASRGANVMQRAGAAAHGISNFRLQLQMARP